jgi:hypothetical protein
MRNVFVDVRFNVRAETEDEARAIVKNWLEEEQFIGIDSPREITTHFLLPKPARRI